MADVNIFEAASRKKLMFSNPRGGGYLSVSHLWDLDIAALNTLLVDIKRQLDEEQKFGINLFEETTPNSNTATNLQLMHDIVLHIGKVLVQERKDRQSAEERKVKKQRLLELIEAKQDEVLSNKSIEELLEELENL
jgi:hypothetical protein